MRACVCALPNMLGHILVVKVLKSNISEYYLKIVFKTLFFKVVRMCATMSDLCLP